MPPQVILTPASVAVEPGEVAVVQIRVRNTGDVVEQYSLAVVGAAASWSVLDPPDLRIFPGQEATGTLQLRPPRDATVTAGKVAFGVKAVPASDPSSSAVEEGEVEVRAFSAVTADLSPRNVEGTAATHSVRVRNSGNAPAEVTVAVVDPDERTVHAIAEPRLAVAPGSEAATSVKVTARGGKRRAPRRLGYQVIVTPSGAPPISLDASLSLAARRRRTPLVAAALVLAVALIAFLALRPKVESATTQIKQIRGEVAAAQKAVEQAKAQVVDAKEAAADAKKEIDEAGEAVDAAGESVEAATGSTVTTGAGGVLGQGSGIPTDAAAGPTTTATPTTVVAGALTGQKPFGATEPKVTCVGGGTAAGIPGSSRSGSGSTTSSTRP